MNYGSWTFVIYFFLFCFVCFFVAVVLINEFIIGLIRNGVPVLLDFIFKKKKK